MQYANTTKVLKQSTDDQLKMLRDKKQQYKDQWQKPIEMSNLQVLNKKLDTLEMKFSRGERYSDVKFMNSEDPYIKMETPKIIKHSLPKEKDRSLNTALDFTFTAFQRDPKMVRIGYGAINRPYLSSHMTWKIRVDNFTFNYRPIIGVIQTIGWTLNGVDKYLRPKNSGNAPSSNYAQPIHTNQKIKFDIKKFSGIHDQVFIKDGQKTDSQYGQDKNRFNNFKQGQIVKVSLHSSEAERLTMTRTTRATQSMSPRNSDVNSSRSETQSSFQDDRPISVISEEGSSMRGDFSVTYDNPSSLEDQPAMYNRSGNSHNKLTMTIQYGSERIVIKNISDPQQQGVLLVPCIGLYEYGSTAEIFM